VWIVLLGLSASIIGCAGGLPPTHYYTLRAPQELAPETPEAMPGEGLFVGVETFVVDPPYDQDRLVYRQNPGSSEVGFYAYHRWASPLGRLLSVAIADGLRGTPGIASIEPAISGGDYSARLRGRVIHLEEVDLPEAQEARMALRLTLEGSTGEILWSQTVSGAARSRAETASEMILMIQKALDGLLLEARGGLAAALER
jgi:uncharacterized lipoprotein YmbA